MTQPLDPQDAGRPHQPGRPDFAGPSVPGIPPQPDPYAQPNQYAQPGQYAQPNQYGQPGQYGQPAAPGSQPVDPYTVPQLPQAMIVPPIELPERVGRGLLFSLLGVLGGLLLTVLLWKIGFIASITSYVMAVGALWFYGKGSGGGMRRGALPLLLVILLGVVLTMLACVGLDAADYYRQEAPPDAEMSMASFVWSVVTDPEVLKDYTKDFLMMLLFAALGMWRVITSLVGMGRQQA